jgi:Outer membrane protein beta-barrel domain
MRLRSIVFLLCVCAAVSRAQVAEVALSLGQSIMKDNVLGMANDLSGTTYNIQNGFRITARFTLNTKRFIGHEFGYGYSRTQLGIVGSPSQTVGMPTHQGFYNFLLYAAPEGSRVRPFATGGAQFSTFVPPGASVVYGTGTTKYGGNYGGGVKVRLNSMFLVRFDVRDYVTGKPFNLINQSGALQQIEVSAGLGLFF